MDVQKNDRNNVCTAEGLWRMNQWLNAAANICRPLHVSIQQKPLNASKMKRCHGLGSRKPTFISILSRKNTKLQLKLNGSNLIQTEKMDGFSDRARIRYRDITPYFWTQFTAAPLPWPVAFAEALQGLPSEALPCAVSTYTADMLTVMPRSVFACFRVKSFPGGFRRHRHKQLDKACQPIGGCSCTLQPSLKTTAYLAFIVSWSLKRA